MGFKHSYRTRLLKKVGTLRAHARLGVKAAVGKGLPPRAALTDWGVSVVVGESQPPEALVNGIVHFSEPRQSVDAVEDIGWIGKDVLLLRLRMRDLVQGQAFERWVVFDCAHEEVEYLVHDLFPPPGCVIRTIRSSARGHAWLQCLRVQPEEGRMQQVVLTDGGILELHRLPLTRLLTTDDMASPLLGRQSRFYSPTLSILTDGEYNWLEPGKQVVIDDVREGEHSDLSFVAALSERRADALDAELLNLYELVRHDDGKWAGAHLFEVCADEDWMIF